jgi:subtilisin family serine protease
VITVGASSHNGTVDRSDDTVAAFSSRGPSAIDFQAKPDLVAPGVGIESIAEAGSTLWNTKPLMRLWGRVPTATEPYLSLSGTSMAAPVVSGTIALMLQADPDLTPNLVKAILQYTAEAHANYNDLTQGAGFLNARGAVEAARAATGAPVDASADPTPWSGQVIWGNHRLSGDAVGAIAAAGAWSADVTWGAGSVLATAAPDAENDNIVWGTECGGADCNSIVWGTSSSAEGENIVWGTNALDDADNLVWGPPAVIRRQPRIPVVIDPALQ